MQQSQCKKPRNKDPRNIIINAKLSKKKQKPSFINNKIKTAKYNFVDFIPKCIFLQFMRLVNFYFLAVAVMQCIDEIASLAPFSAIAPLGFVLVVSLIREAFDDIVNTIFCILK